MALTRKDINKLIEKLYDGTINSSERELLNMWVDEQMSKDTCEVDSEYLSNEEELKKRIFSNILSKTDLFDSEKYNSNRKRKWIKISLVAASLILFLAFSLSYYLTNRIEQPKAILSINKYINPDSVNVESNNALLTLESGEVIALSSEKDGIVIRDNRLAYEEGGVLNSNTTLDETNSKNKLLTVSTPNATIFKVTLPDGSIAWLNANSTISYPRSFNSQERKILFTGEGYFSVVKDPKRPFVIVGKNQDVEVLGTSFNIYDYDKENGSLTTLIEGSVKIRSKESELASYKILSPNQQASVNAKGIEVNTVDASTAIAWKSGQFYFNGASPKIALEQLANWYGLDIEYSGHLSPTKFFGMIDRKKNLGSILKILDKSGLKFKLQQNESKMKLIVYQ